MQLPVAQAEPTPGKTARKSGDAPEAPQGLQSLTDCKEEHNQFINAYTFCDVWWDAATWNMRYKVDYTWHNSGSSVSNIRYVTAGGLGIQDDIKIEYIQPSVSSSDDVASARATVSQNIGAKGVNIKSTVGILIEVCAAWNRKAHESPVNV